MIALLSLMKTEVFLEAILRPVTLASTLYGATTMQW